VEETRRMGASGSDGVILVDVRNATDYDAAHIKGAISIPLANFTNGTVALNKSVKIVVYSEDGTNSTIATGILMEQGFGRVYNVVGGINAWNESGYSMVSTAEEHPAAPGFELALALVAVLVIALRVRRK
jgi:MYXO-CTERM domain-containing protein